MPGHRLREEIGTLEVDRDELVEAVLGRVQDVGAHARRDARVVDEGVEAAERGQRVVDDALAVVRLRDVAGDEGKVLVRARAQGATGGQRLLGRRAVAAVVDGEVEAVAAQRLRDPAPEAAAGSGHEGGRGWWRGGVHGGGLKHRRG